MILDYPAAMQRRKNVCPINVGRKNSHYDFAPDVHCFDFLLAELQEGRGGLQVFYSPEGRHTCKKLLTDRTTQCSHEYVHVLVERDPMSVRVRTSPEGIQSTCSSHLSLTLTGWIWRMYVDLISFFCLLVHDERSPQPRTNGTVDEALLVERPISFRGPPRPTSNQCLVGLCRQIIPPSKLL